MANTCRKCKNGFRSMGNAKRNSCQSSQKDRKNHSSRNISYLDHQKNHKTDHCYDHRWRGKISKRKTVFCIVCHDQSTVFCSKKSDKQSDSGTDRLFQAYRDHTYHCFSQTKERDNDKKNTAPEDHPCCDGHAYPFIGDHRCNDPNASKSRCQSKWTIGKQCHCTAGHNDQKDHNRQRRMFVIAGTCQNVGNRGKYVCHSYKGCQTCQKFCFYICIELRQSELFFQPVFHLFFPLDMMIESIVKYPYQEVKFILYIKIMPKWNSRRSL